MNNLFLPIIPVLGFVIWIGLLLYGIVLATRFVTAVEQIASALSRRPGDRPQV
jgi:Ca2+/Na+ antiporter